jgi:hypothetical protein
MSTSVIGSQLDAIRAGLVIVSGLAGVNIFSGDASMEEAGQECVVFGNGTLVEEAFAMGGDRQEVWTVGGQIRVVKPWAGSTELTIKAARDRALAILALVETYLNDTYPGALPDDQLVGATLENSIAPGERVCSLTFDFTVMTVKNP